MSAVRPAPVVGVVLRVLPLWLVWLAVVVLGRLVCHAAQRVPPIVHLVRLVRRHRSTSAQARERVPVVVQGGTAAAPTGSR